LTAVLQDAIAAQRQKRSDETAALLDQAVLLAQQLQYL
jgi:hypothetical protein